jgi:hypothetical protein
MFFCLYLSSKLHITDMLRNIIFLPLIFLLQDKRPGAQLTGADRGEET